MDIVYVIYAFLAGFAIGVGVGALLAHRNRDQSQRDAYDLVERYIAMGGRGTVQLDPDPENWTSTWLEPEE